MSDPTKQWQRNIRIPPELWSYVQAQAKIGRGGLPNCAAVISQWIRERMTQDGLVKPVDH